MEKDNKIKNIETKISNIHERIKTNRICPICQDDVKEEDTQNVVKMYFVLNVLRHILILQIIQYARV